jgi:hypothetical protein
MGTFKKIEKIINEWIEPTVNKTEEYVRIVYEE